MCLCGSFMQMCSWLHFLPSFLPSFPSPMPPWVRPPHYSVAPVCGGYGGHGLKYQSLVACPWPAPGGLSKPHLPLFPPHASPCPCRTCPPPATAWPLWVAATASVRSWWPALGASPFPSATTCYSRLSRSWTGPPSLCRQVTCMHGLLQPDLLQPLPPSLVAEVDIPCLLLPS